MKQPIRFQGQWEDEETGLYYNRYRYYDSSQGRYITQDPIGLAGVLNSYAYVGNPTGWVDPLGLSPACRSFQYDSRTRTRTCIDNQTVEQACVALGSQMTVRDGFCQLRDLAALTNADLNSSTVTHDDSESSINLCAAIGALAGEGEMPPEIDIADKMATGFDHSYYLRHGEKVPHIDKMKKIASITTRFQNLQEHCKATAGKQNWQLQNWD